MWMFVSLHEAAAVQYKWKYEYGGYKIFQPMIRGHHVHKAIWEATVDGELLSFKRELGNIHDTFSVAVKKDGSYRWALSMTIFY